MAIVDIFSEAFFQIRRRRDAIAWLRRGAMLVALAALPTACAPATDGNAVAANGMGSIAGNEIGVASADQAPVATNAVETAPAPNSWEYQTTRDEMRDTSARIARLVSENQIELSWPYGTVSGHLIIRDRSQDGLNVMFTVDEGQILCNSYSGGHLSLRFDHGPVETFSCDEATGGTNDLVFFSSEHEILRRLQHAHRLILEADFYDAGTRQFTFNVAGLQWTERARASRASASSGADENLDQATED
jgi:hypothetical protein